MRLNETPVRTSNNFNINNIELDIDIPNNLKKFETVEIINENCSICKDVTDTSLIYGTGLKVQNSNNNLKIVTEGKNANVKLVYNFDANNLNLVNNIEILAENDLNLVIQYSSNTNSRCFHNGIIKLKANANVNITIVNMLNELSDNFESIESIIENNAKVNYTIIDIGAKNSISNYYANALGKKCENNVKTIYLGTQNQLKDINYIVDINGQESSVDIDVQGTLKDESKKHFKGTIDFKKGCKKAKGNENEFCILLSDKAKSLALPMLLCTEDDVEGNHSTASGKVDNKDLFYIMSRGISYKDAIKLLVKAKFNQIIQTIKDEQLKQEILEQIDRRLD